MAIYNRLSTEVFRHDHDWFEEYPMGKGYFILSCSCGMRYYPREHFETKVPEQVKESNLVRAGEVFINGESIGISPLRGRVRVPPKPIEFKNEYLAYIETDFRITQELWTLPQYNPKNETFCNIPIEKFERGEMKYSDILAAELAKVLEKEKAREDAFGIEPTGLRSVVVFDIQFTERGKWYNYAAIRCGDNKWYTTGTKRTSGYTWEELLNFITEIYKYRKFKVAYTPKAK